MKGFIFDGIRSLYNSFRQRIWPSDAVKRRRDSDDENEDDILLSCQTLKKKPKWTADSFQSNLNMASSDSRPLQSLNNKLTVNVPIRKKAHVQAVQQRSYPVAKEIDPDLIEVVEIEDDVEVRPALASLSVKTKSRSLPMAVSREVVYNGTPSHPTPRNHIHERRQNGIHPFSFTSSIRFGKSSTPKQTAINESFKMDDRIQYSRLLAQYHKSTGSTLQEPQPQLTHIRQWPAEGEMMKCRPSLTRTATEFVDLTVQLEEPQKRRTRVKPVPWQPTSSLADDVKLVEELPPIPRVNSFEKKLVDTPVCSFQWIQDLQHKYGDRERETQRQLEETRLHKELYAQHNEARRMEALDERIRRHLKLTDVVLDDTELQPSLPEITKQMAEKINNALRPNPPREVLVEGFGQRITRLDLQTLNKLNWLNDEVINFYMNLLIERGKGDKNPKIYAFNTFFYPKLVSQGYSTLRRWTKKVDIFDYELLLVPIHLGMHWCMATIDLRDKTVRYYDSMGSENNRCLNALLKYLTEESLDKKKTPYDVSGWKTENVKDIPQQMNGSDCGMFSCMFAEYVSRNAKISFSQKDMPYFRRKMVYEIITKQLLQ